MVGMYACVWLCVYERETDRGKENGMESIKQTSAEEMGWPRQDSYRKNSVLWNQTQVHSNPSSDTMCSSEIRLPHVENGNRNQRAAERIV